MRFAQRRRIRLRSGGLQHFNMGGPAQALGGGIQQARTEHAGNPAIGAGRNDQQVHTKDLIIVLI